MWNVFEKIKHLLFIGILNNGNAGYMLALACTFIHIFSLFWKFSAFRIISKNFFRTVLKLQLIRFLKNLLFPRISVDFPKFVNFSVNLKTRKSTITILYLISTKVSINPELPRYISYKQILSNISIFLTSFKRFATKYDW